MILTLMTGCSSSSSSTTPANLSASPVSFGDKSSYEISAGNQHTDGKSVIITEVTMKAAGWVAVHTDANGAPGVVLGVSSLLQPGTHNNVTVSFAKTLSAGTKVMPVVHEERAKCSRDQERNSRTHCLMSGPDPGMEG